MTQTDLHDWLSEFDWKEPRTVKGVSGTMQVLDMVDSQDKEFWNLWRDHKSAMKSMGVAPSKDEDTDEWTVSWFQNEGTAPIHRAPLTPMVKVQNVLQDDGKGTLDPIAWEILKPRQRLAATTLFSVRQNGHPFALDASAMGRGKTYTALAVAKSLGLNFGIICPANVCSKWTDTSIDIFGIEPEFIFSWDIARSGRTDPFIDRINLAKTSKFKVNAFEPVLIILDEIHVASAPDSLNAAVFKACIENPHVFTLGLSGTAATNPTQMKVLGQALELHAGHDYWKWALANGCYKNFWGGLQFTEKQSKAVVYLSAMHAHIFPNRGCRLLPEEDTARGDVPAHEVFCTGVDVPDKLPKELEKYIEVIEAKCADDLAKAQKKDPETDVLPIVEQIRSRQMDELSLVPYSVERAEEALAEGCSVPIFVCFESTIQALADLLKKHDPMFFKGSTSRETKTENLRKFQYNSHRLLLLNSEAGSAGIDLHDLLGLHPRYSIIFPTYKALTLQQACARTDREGKKSVSTVELPFLNTGVHQRIMKSVNKKINNLSLIMDGELSGFELKKEIL